MKTADNAAFYYLLDGYNTHGKSLMGRQSAGEGFLKGFARHSGVDTLYCHAPNAGLFKYFQETVAQAAGKDKACSLIAFHQFYRLNEIGCLFVPGPALSDHVWSRRYINSRAYSICGVTHTTATDRIMDSFGTLLINPVQNWDAIVCTSQVVKKTVHRVIQGYGDYLVERLGARPEISVQLPIIPLGVDCDQYYSKDAESHRAAWREKLSLGPDDIAVLYMGRFSFTTKAHPLPMFLALDEAARQTDKKICLIMAGWFDPPASEKVWQQDVAKFCPSVNVVFLDGRQDDVRTEIWSAADIFVSLSDNIQETFGLTPIEAMAAGLPVVVTDWDGYRDTVRHGVDGFRIPTFMPEPGLGEDLSMRFTSNIDSYGRYCGIVSQMTTVDIGATVQAFIKLFQDKETRITMGKAGQQRARSEYDWSIVVKKYQELWGELSRRRLFDREIVPLRKGQPSHPLRIDPFTLFLEYPSAHITGDTLITLQAGRHQGWLDYILSSPMNSYISPDKSLLLSKSELGTIIEHLTKNGDTTLADITRLFHQNKGIIVRRTIGWMGKNGLIGIRVSQNQGGRS